MPAGTPTGRKYVDICLPPDVKTATAFLTGSNKVLGDGLDCAQGEINRIKPADLSSYWLKLGTNSPRLLQCIRDPSQPSSAVELANLAAYA